MVPAGGGLVAPPAGGPAQGEGQPGAGDDPGGVLRGKESQPGGFGDRQLDESDSAGARLAAAGGHRRVAEGDHQVSVVNVTVVAVILGGAGTLAAGGGGKGYLAVQGAADSDVAELGEAARAVCRQIPSHVLTWDWSQPSTSFPVLNVSSIGHC